MPKFEFTMVSTGMLKGLAEAGATGAEMRAYIMLVMGLPKDRSRSECWMPADTAEEKGVMSARMFTKCMDSLTKKKFTAPNGKKIPVITRVTRGCRGHCPHYRDNLGKAIAESAKPKNGTPTGDPKTHEMGHQN